MGEAVSVKSLRPGQLAEVVACPDRPPLVGKVVVGIAGGAAQIVGNEGQLFNSLTEARLLQPGEKVVVE